MARAMASFVAPSLSLASTRPSPSRLSFAAPPFPKPQQRGRLTITCIRVGGVEIPNEKRIEYSLQYVHGIGRSRSRQILNDLQIDNKITKDLTEEEVIAVRNELKNYRIEGDLRRFNRIMIQRLIDIRHYRGRRHQKGLPCRGQRTKNNCRTLKGKRMPVAGKKKAAR